MTQNTYLKAHLHVEDSGVVSLLWIMTREKLVFFIGAKKRELKISKENVKKPLPYPYLLHITHPSGSNFSGNKIK